MRTVALRGVVQCSRSLSSIAADAHPCRTRGIEGSVGDGSHQPATPPARSISKTRHSPAQQQSAISQGSLLAYSNLSTHLLFPSRQALLSIMNTSCDWISKTES